MEMCPLLNSLHGKGFHIFDDISEILKDAGADFLHSCPYKVKSWIFLGYLHV